MNTGGIQLRLGDFVYAILKRWKLVLALTFLGLVFGIMLSAVSYMQGSYSNYEITGSFVVLMKNDKSLFTADQTNEQLSGDYHFAEDAMDTVTYVIRSDRNMNRAIDSLRVIGIKPKDLSQNLKLSRYNDTTILEATLTWRDAQEGVNILNAIIDASETTLQETIEVGTISIIDEPAAKQSLGNTLGGSIWIYMTLLGFLAGIGFIALELIMRPTLTNLKDVETVLGLETLGTIPRDEKYFRRKKSLLVEDEIRSPGVTQNYASTAYILRNRLASIPSPRCIFVTSTLVGEGKTSVVANLAIQLSDMEQKVLIIDLNTRNPNLGKLFLNHVEYDRSLNALYRGQATREETIFNLTGFLDLLPAVIDRQTIPMDGTIFDLIKEVSKGYDYVIIDAAPVGQVSETLSLSEVADAVLFVMKYDMATIPEIRSTLEKLDKSGIRVLGCVVNAVQNVAGAAMSEEKSERSGHSHSAFFENYGKEKKVILPKEEESPKKHRFGKKKKKNKEKDHSTENAQTPETAETGKEPGVAKEKSETVVKNSATLLTEIMQDTTKTQEKQMSDADAAEALFKIGMEGSWDEQPAETESTPESGEETPKNQE